VKLNHKINLLIGSLKDQLIIKLTHYYHTA